MNKLLSSIFLLINLLSFHFGINSGCGIPCSDSLCTGTDKTSTDDTICMGGSIGKTCDGCGSSNCGLYNAAQKICTKYKEYFGDCTGCSFECS